MRLESSISRNMRFFLILKLESSISWFIRNFLILEQESSVSWNIRNFFRMDFFLFFYFFFIFFFLSLGLKVCQGDLYITTIFSILLFNFGGNVLHWSPYIQLFKISFQSSSYGHVLVSLLLSLNTIDKLIH